MHAQWGRFFALLAPEPVQKFPAAVHETVQLPPLCPPYRHTLSAENTHSQSIARSDPPVGARTRKGVMRVSLYSQHWKIDGVSAAFVARGAENGRYQVLFERENAELPAIEAIHWDRPTVEHLMDREELGLPEGYGFEVVDITYHHKLKSYFVELQVAGQYLGDVTGYQAQVEALEAQVQDLTSQAAQAAAQEAQAAAASEGAAPAEETAQAAETAVQPEEAK